MPRHLEMVRTKCQPKSWSGQNANHRKKSGQYANLWLALCPVGILSGWHFVLPPVSQGMHARSSLLDRSFKNKTPARQKQIRREYISTSCHVKLKRKRSWWHRVLQKDDSCRSFLTELRLSSRWQHLLWHGWQRATKHCERHIGPRHLVLKLNQQLQLWQRPLQQRVSARQTDNASKILSNLTKVDKGW